RETEVCGDNALGGLPLGVEGEAFAGELLQRREDARAGGEGVLVEVEAQGVAAREGWMVLRHREHGAARLYLRDFRKMRKAVEDIFHEDAAFGFQLID